jgi:signal transduction histidine kinase
VHRREQQKTRPTTRAPGRSNRLLTVLLLLHLPALIAFGLARNLATVGWVAVYALAVIVESAVLLVLWRSADGVTNPAQDRAADRLENERQRSEFAAEQQQVTGDLLISLARRNQSLLHRQLAKIDEMEAREQDPAALSQLFAVDHLATRMRRNAESLLVLSGEESVRKLTRPTPMSEVLRGAIAEIEDYQRVDVTISGDADVVGRAVVDVVHLLAELIENAAAFSPPGTRVVLNGTRSRHGYSVTITDHGVGFSSEELERKNALLATPEHESVPVSEMLGFLVVRRLANRFDITVRIASQPNAGTVVTVEIPATVLMREQQAMTDGAPDVRPSAAAPESEVAAAASFPRQYLPADEPPDNGYAPPPTFAPPAYEPSAAQAPAAPAMPPTPPRPAMPPMPAAPAMPPMPPAPQPTPAYAGIPLDPALAQRVPQSSLAPQMRSGPVSPIHPGDVAASPAPEHARSLLSAYRTGLTLGRSGILDESGLTPDRYGPPVDAAGPADAEFSEDRP